MHERPAPTHRRIRRAAARTALAIAAGAASLLVASPSSGTVLYKSIAANGVIQFSDTPPGNGVIVEERAVRDPRDAAAASPAAPAEAFENPLQTVADGSEPDTTLARANAQVDLAEHALALARRSMWHELEGLRLRSGPKSRTDAERVEFYRRDLKIAHANLIDALRRRGQ